MTAPIGFFILSFRPQKIQLSVLDEFCYSLLFTIVREWLLHAENEGREIHFFLLGFILRKDKIF